MDFLTQIPPKCLEFIKELGKTQWLKPIFENDNFISFKPNVPSEVYLKYKLIADHLLHGFSTSDALMMLAGIVELISNGPKIFHPTYEQCESLENVDINIPASIYHQPYKAIQIYFPKEYILKLEREFLTPISQGLLIFDSEHFIAAISNGFNKKEDFQRVVYKNNGEDIELQLHSIELSKELDESTNNKLKKDLPIHLLLHRLGLNLCLLLANHPTKINFLDKNLEKLLSHQNRAIRREAEKKEKTSSKIISFVQDVVVRKIINESTPLGSNPDHYTQRPHWRRGHYRNYIAGERFKKNKIVFIQPIFVNSWKFIGEKANTAAIYSTV